MESEPIRVVVADDEPMVCAHLRSVLGAADGIEVVDECCDGAAAVEAVVRHRPDVVLIDLRMPGVDGFAATERITALAHPPAVVALTTFDTDEHITRALRAGASGFLLKTTLPEDLIGLVRVAAAGHSVLSAPVARRLLDRATDRQQADGSRRTAIGAMTDRELEVLGCLGLGLTNAEIAGRLRLSEVTVKGHVSRILAKLHCGNRTQAGLLAHQAGLPAP